MNEVELNKKVASSLKWLAASKFASQLVTWGATIMIMRLLAPNDYGIMAIVSVFTGFLAILSELGLGTAVIREREIGDRKLSVLYGALYFSSLAISAVLFLAAPFISSFYHENRLTPLIRVMSVQFLLASTYIIPYALLQREMKFKSVALIDTVVTAIGSLITLLLAWNGFSYWSLALGILADGFLRALLVNTVAKCHVSPQLAFREAWELLRFGGYVALGRLVWFFTSQADIIIASRLLAAESLGYYTVSLNLANIPVDKVMAITNQVALPAFANIQDNLGETRKRLLQAIRLLALVMFPILWGLSSVAEELVKVLLTDKWMGAALPMLLVPLVLPLRVIGNTVATVVMSMGLANSALKGNLRNTLLMVCSFLIGIHWDILGLCLAWVIGLPIAVTLNLRSWLPLLGTNFSDGMKALIGPVIAAAIMYASVLTCRIILNQVDSGTLLGLCMSVTKDSSLCGIFPPYSEIGILPRLCILITTGITVYLGIVWWTMRDDCNRLLRILR